jgi:hypothetical protein
MGVATRDQTDRRYGAERLQKATGATYTPQGLADFVARRIVERADGLTSRSPIRILDPAAGDGALLESILGLLATDARASVEVHGFDTDERALEVATDRLRLGFPGVHLHMHSGSFLEHVLDHFGPDGQGNLFAPVEPVRYDLIIANPPYVRTQILGADEAKAIARMFGLSGRVDLYHAFLIAMADVLDPAGVAGVIVSNRFMTTKSGAAVRRAIRERFHIGHVWDLGDTKLFDAAVLPAVLLLEGRSRAASTPGFTSIYETTSPPEDHAADPIEALSRRGVVGVSDGRRFLVQHGELSNGESAAGIWRIATSSGDAWLATVEARSWGTFRDIGKTRVGVKTCADKVFVRSDWNDLPRGEIPELLRPLTTHHMARRFKPLALDDRRYILYPHEKTDGTRQPVDLSRYPRARAYLEKHREALEARTYVIESGREWYEIWVPQDPGAWDAPKLVFRDITEKPTFWIDEGGSVVNGDCYWLTCEERDQTDLLWLAAAVGNSSFIETFYDRRFHNKLYSGRRRFITQYVEQFPLPDPSGSAGKEIIAKAKAVHDAVDAPGAPGLAAELDQLVWQAFGLCLEEAPR